MVSLPPSPQITSRPFVPRRTSGPGVPRSVHTMVRTEAELSATFGSVSFARTWPASVIPPPACARATRVTVAVAPDPSDPSEHVTVLVPAHVPWLGVADIRVTVAGKPSVATTFVPRLGPPFRTVSTYVSFARIFRGSGESEIERDRLIGPQVSMHWQSGEQVTVAPSL